MLLSDKVAIITGGAKGMGKGMALKFADEGCHVAIADISLKDAEETLSEILKKGREGLAIECDVTNSKQVGDMVNKVISKFGKIDILVNNAGTLLHIADPTKRSITAIPENEWDKLVEINLKVLFMFQGNSTLHERKTLRQNNQHLFHRGYSPPGSCSPLQCR